MSTNRRRKNIIFLCTGNSCRSQMAEGYLRYFAGDKAYIYSAGVEARGVNSLAMTVMQEDGIDISGHTSNHMREYHLIDFDFVLTLCDPAKESCPLLPKNIKQIHVTFDDPGKATGSHEKRMQKFRKVRDEIKAFTKQFAEEYL
ncbi:MAG TPA: arsenate reductase ArsC [Flavobacteriaceae bacterium]|nr:arsenate reductase ArsC [Flavobacteriaceae bacterium]